MPAGEIKNAIGAPLVMPIKTQLEVISIW
jgi:hypothetical protein